MDSDHFRKNPYDFESDDEDLTSHVKQRPNSSVPTESIDSKNALQPLADAPSAEDELLEQGHRVPPLKIVWTRAVVPESTDADR